MTAPLARLLGRLPIGWLQLTHSRTRMAAALAGVTFANMLVFLQLGMMGALNGTIGMTYAPVRTDILISSVDANTLTDGSPLSRRVLFQALSDPDVAAAAPFYLTKVDWTRDDGSTASLNVYALPVEATRFAGPAIAPSLTSLSIPDSALIDQRTRGADPAALATVTPATPLRFEANGRTITATGSFALGGGFSADGALVVSDRTFLRLFPSRIARTPTHVLVDVAPGADPATVATRLSTWLAGDAVQVRTMSSAQAADLSYQTTQRPTGVIFGFGVAMGVLVGPSGSGKTTVLTLMGCLRDVQDGSVRLLGTERNGANTSTQEATRRRLGFIFQAHNLHDSLTARQNVLMGLGVHGRGDPAKQAAAAEHLLTVLGLDQRIDYLPASLSGGQKQRVAIARALVSNPEVIFADEPTAALDHDSGLSVVRMLKQLGAERGTTTVMVTHDKRILELADRIVTLEDGRIVRDRVTA